MSIRLQISVAVLVLVMLLTIVNMVRKEKIDLRYALSWIVLCALVLVLDAFPGILEWVARLLGIEIPSNMIFIFAIFLLVVTVYSLTASVSRLADKNKRLTQELALLREEVESIKNSHD